MADTDKKRISDLDDAAAVNEDTLVEISQPIKETATDGTVTITGYKSLKAKLSYFITLLKNTAMSFPWLSVPGIDKLGEIDASNGMQVKWSAAADTTTEDKKAAAAAALTDQPYMAVTGYGRSLYKMPFYASDVGFIVTDDTGNVLSFVQAAKKDLSNVDMPTLVGLIDKQRGSAPVLSNAGDQSVNGSFGCNFLSVANWMTFSSASSGWQGLRFTRNNVLRMSWLANDNSDWLFLAMQDDGGNYIGDALKIERLSGNSFINHLYPRDDNVQYLGGAGNRWSVIYAVNGTIQTSDERLKDNIAPIPDNVLDVWEKVSPWCQFTMTESSNEDPRLHLGAIAQKIIKAFSDAGLDAFRYGLACYDKWEESSKQEFDKMIDFVDPETKEKIKQPSYKTVTIPAGDRYSLRYDECLVLEAALMRRTKERLEERIAKLEKPS